MPPRLAAHPGSRPDPRRVRRPAARVRGPPISDAVRAVVRPVGEPPDLHRPGRGSGSAVPQHAGLHQEHQHRPRPHPQMRRDGARRRRRELFRTSVVGPDTLLRAGERMGSLQPGTYGGEVAPAGSRSMRCSRSLDTGCHARYTCGSVPSQRTKETDAPHKTHCRSVSDDPGLHAAVHEQHGPGAEG